MAKLALDYYVDADFAGLWNIENESDPVCIKSRTSGYVLLFGGCPLTWASMLQSEIALSTLEAEYISIIYSYDRPTACKSFVKGN